jgi:hypothetical protein
VDAGSWQLPNVALQKNFNKCTIEIVVRWHNVGAIGKYDRRFFARFGRRFHPAFTPFPPFFIIRAPK